MLDQPQVAATAYVRLPLCKRSGPEKIVFVNHVRAEPNHQIQLSRPHLPHCAPRRAWLQNNVHPQHISRARLRGLFWLQRARLRAGPSAQTCALATWERRAQLSHPHKCPLKYSLHRFRGDPHQPPWLRGVCPPPIRPR